MMSDKKLNHISIIGSGTMGNGIAHSFAFSGFNVTLIDISEDSLRNAIVTINKNLDRQVSKNLISEKEKENILQKIKTSVNSKEGVRNADLVIEAASENMDIKIKIFKDLSEFTKPEAILASNISSISINKNSFSNP